MDNQGTPNDSNQGGMGGTVPQPDPNQDGGMPASDKPVTPQSDQPAPQPSSQPEVPPTGTENSGGDGSTGETPAGGM